MKQDEALKVLAQVKLELGRNYKSSIRTAWENGNYYEQGLENWTGPLQNIRNTFGPSWLVKAKPSADLVGQQQREQRLCQRLGIRHSTLNP